jgi:hypothetical protein
MVTKPLPVPTNASNAAVSRSPLAVKPILSTALSLDRRTRIALPVYAVRSFRKLYAAELFKPSSINLDEEKKKALPNIFYEKFRETEIRN